MPTKIKRCLYIGLGGTGMNALLHTKKVFFDTYGEIPPMIGFLGIDTDSGAYKKSLSSISGEEIALEPNEQLPIYVEDARAVYEVNKDDLSWVPTRNLNDLDKMTLGAGQIRTNGRFAFTAHYKDVANKVKNIINQITNASIIDNDRYELLSNDVEIHVVFSLGGGTGCGTFINMAYLLRNEVPRCKLTGYAVLPDVFKAMSTFGMANVKPNAYGAMCDLDYLMHIGISSEPLTLGYTHGFSQVVNREPFDAVIFIDNKNSNGDTYAHIDELTEMISLALVTSAGELSTATASVSDNLAKEIRKGTRDIENKKAWAAGMGICELIYRNSSISRIYATKAAKILIERLFNSCEDTDTIVNAWIDSPEVNIRENNGNDHVIDFIADRMPKNTIESIDYDEPNTAVEQYLISNKIKDEVIKEKVTALSTRVRTELRKLLINYINKECGISTCINILEGIEAQVDMFLKEMKDEKEQFTDKQPMFRTSVNSAMDDLKAYNKKFFKTRSKLDELDEDVRAEAQKLCICQREITRRDAAIQVFNAVKAMLAEANTKIRNISNCLLAVTKILTSKLAKMQNDVNRNVQTFQIDLAQSLITSLTIKPEEIQISDFVRTLPGERKIYGFEEYSTEEIENFIMKYTNLLHSTKEHQNTSIDDVINRLTDDDFERIVKQAIGKSMPLLRYNYKGHSPEEQPRDSFYIGVQDKVNSRLAKNDYFKKLVQGTADCDFSNIGNTEKIVIYRIIGVLPAYSITSISDCKPDYENCKNDCHIDYNWETRMQREDFSLMPKREKDDDILDFWVKGLIFGLVKNEDGEYKFQSDEHGDALDDYWVSLGKYRDEAFDKFRSYKSSVRKEFADKLEDIAHSRGADAMNARLAEVKAAYLDKFSQINMTKEEIKRKGFERIRQLITDEINHVKSFNTQL